MVGRNRRSHSLRNIRLPYILHSLTSLNRSGAQRVLLSDIPSLSFISSLNPLTFSRTLTGQTLFLAYYVLLVENREILAQVVLLEVLDVEIDLLEGLLIALLEEVQKLVQFLEVFLTELSIHGS